LLIKTSVMAAARRRHRYTAFIAWRGSDTRWSFDT